MALLTEDQQNVAVKALATTLGRPVSEIEEILAGEKPTEVDALITTRIKTLRDDADKAGRGKLQVAANKKAKEVFQLDTKSETIEDLIMAIKESYTPEVDPGKLTEEQIKSSDVFRTLESTLATERKKHEKDLADAKAEGEQTATKERLSAKAMKALNDYGAVLSTDAKLAAVQERMYLEGLEGITTKVVDGKTEFWKEGKRIENDKLFPVSEEDFFKSLVEKTYTTKVSEQKSNSGLNPEDGRSNNQQAGEFKHFKGDAPKSQDDVDKILMDRTKHDFNARKEVQDYWKAEQDKTK